MHSGYKTDIVSDIIDKLTLNEVFSVVDNWDIGSELDIRNRTFYSIYVLLLLCRPATYME